LEVLVERVKETIGEALWVDSIYQYKPIFGMK
jgi:hypothetical protein